ncbi:DEAD/DEAH box helicase [Streptomyces sp. H10-C2]|uniref:DEAD/DEAH box helicase n=1 Tax=unclassified Streptomyces TaxID=2593676 RepID=UPI0024B8930E|nr:MULTISPECIES: DEAD/DEAH box helicase [unclassified Streptomyces]MDJ0342617.1 DEAD/DEAH box helicase [Streptomyces sp. PH10-H1]MDJ0368529.1 DEAD/DEAH box helicase [Streptomyces sp. H10-C2]
MFARVPELAAGEAVFLPADPPRMGRVAFWSPGGEPPDLGVEPEELTVVRPHGSSVRRARVIAVPLPVEQALPLLTRCRALGADGSEQASAANTSANASGSTAFWGAAALLGLRLIARGRLLPGVSPEGFDAWRVGPLDAEDHERLGSLAAAMPPEARAVAVPGTSPLTLPAGEPLLRAFLDAVADSLARPPAARLVTGGPAFAVRAPQPVPEQRGWAAEVAAGRDAGLAVSLRLELGRAESFRAVVQLRSLADPTVLADAADLWSGRATAPEHFGPRAQVDTLLTLRRAARVWPPAGRLLDAAAPTGLELSDEEAQELLGDAAESLAAAGVAVHWPKELVRELTASGVLEPVRRKGTQSSAESFLSSGGLLDFRWRVALGDQELDQEELERLVQAHRPIVRLRDQWVVVDPELVRRLRRAAQSRRTSLTAIDALGAALTGSVEVDGEQVAVTAGGVLEELRSRIADDPEARAEREPQGPPQALAATLRDYQLRGLNWLHRMTSLGLGGCLADDMGLGKTVTLIALHLRRQEGKTTAGPTLVVCPASLLGNWEREIQRFAPATPVRRFHGPGRDLAGLDAGADGGFVLTTYGTMRRDAERLAEQPWGLLVADEAQHVKNPHAHTAQALRRIPSRGRVALTGTPVENNLSELWSLLDWTTPGLLGTLTSFRDRYATAVEGDRDEQAARRLAALVRPFLLRRRKSDPGIAPELPPKTETDQPVSLTKEQVSLYEALVRELMAEIEEKQGIARRGLVMKLLTGLKQVCNHPAQFLKEAAGAKLPGRSGKLELLDELLDTVLAEDGSALVFTQYVAMGALIERHLADRGVDTLFLHGGTTVKRREEMVDAFQRGEKKVFLLSLKAAGTGLNLTRAGHVIHYDRWWNPAVEDQATDRAYRIGQTQPVQVHKLIAEGTVEDRIAEMLRQKRELADSVLGSGEAAFSELSDSELAELVTLRRTER